MAITRMISLDLAVSLLVRAVGGLLAAIILAFFGWSIAWLMFRQAATGSASFALPIVLSVGLSAGVAAVAAWWNTESPGKVKALHVALSLAGAVLGGWIGFQFFSGGTHYTWVPGVGTVPVLYLGETLFPTIAGAVIAANLAAGALYLYRAAWRREL